MLVDLIEQAQSAVTTIEVKPEDDDGKILTFFDDAGSDILMHKV